MLLLLAPWLAGAAAHGSDGEPTILVIGDSLSAAHNIPLEAGWVALLDQRLDADGCAAEVVNASISGETSIGGLTRLPELIEAHQPSIVILELGANDGLRGLPLDALAANLRKMVGTAQESGASVLLAGVQIPTNYGRRYAEGFARIYPELSAELGVPLVPFLLEGVALDPQLMQADRLHPTAAAQSVVLGNVYPQLMPLLEWCAVG